jgi:hypothetical protein
MDTRCVAFFLRQPRRRRCRNIAELEMKGRLVMNPIWKLLVCAFFISMGCAPAGAKPVHHYVFFGQDREKLAGASSFLQTKALEGAQVTYSWRQLEPERDAYDFGAIREDLPF